MKTIEAQVTENPWRAVAGALALGALVALESTPSSHKESGIGRTAADVVLGLVGALAMRWVKKIVLHNAGAAANDWYEQFRAGKSPASTWAPAATTPSRDVH